MGRVGARGGRTIQAVHAKDDGSFHGLVANLLEREPIRGQVRGDAPNRDRRDAVHTVLPPALQQYV
ncbi:hypothetical protein Halar_2593 [halophilic archaeon DL31]|jgi:hypothetical protein|nr:hypothetical protein Halar_2593 [halophilic archaeon DL31]